MEKIPLSLSSEQQEPNRPPPQRERTPLSGWLAVGCGILGIVGPAIPFMPLGLLFSVVALFRGQGGWAFAGLVLAVAAFLSSPILMGLAGFGALYMFFDWNELLEPIHRFIGGGMDI